MAIKKRFLEKRISTPAVVTGKDEAAKEISRSASDKPTWPDAKRRFLVTINVVGSAGPIRFVVNGEESVKEVIQRALKHYAREKRVPQLGSDTSTFCLYAADSELGELDPLQRIGSTGAWKFGLCKKQGHPSYTAEIIDKRKASKWVSWLPKSKSFPVRKMDVACN